VADRGAKTDPEIRCQAAVENAIELPAHLGIETGAHDIEERESVGGGGIDGVEPTGEQRAKGLVIRAPETEIAAESVPGAVREQSESGVGSDERLRHLIDHSIPARGDDQLTTVLHGAPGEFDGMSGPLRRDHGGREPVFGDERIDSREQRRSPRMASRPRIENETDLQSTEARTHGVRRNPSLAAGRTSPAVREWDCIPTAFQTDRPPMERVLHVLTGPTAVGKTEWALRWAEANDAEIISCDSLLFYRGMDVGTAKPTAAERARVPHHLIDVVDVNEAWDVTRYVCAAREACEGIRARGRRVLVTGGSGFYLKAFFAPVADAVAVPFEVRKAVAARLEEAGLATLVEELRTLNPAGLGALDVSNPRRVARALERCRASHRTLAELAEAFSLQPAPFAEWQIRLTRLDRPRAELDARIDARVRTMLAGGLADEVRRLLAAGLRTNPSAAKAIGYRETITWLDGGIREDEMAGMIARNTRALVKKQLTWFRTQLPPHRVLPVGEVDLTALFT